MSKRDYWVELLERWEKSGISGKKFCEQENLNYPNFIRWKNVLSDQKEQGFVEVGLDRVEFLEFWLGGIHLRVKCDISTENLSRLILASNGALKLC